MVISSRLKNLLHRQHSQSEIVTFSKHFLARHAWIDSRFFIVIRLDDLTGFLMESQVAWTFETG